MPLPKALSRPLAARYSLAMATATKKFLCMQCDMPEEKCQCEKYCAFCQGQAEIRLCHDGLYYCPPCREAAEYKTQEEYDAGK